MFGFRLRIPKFADHPTISKPLTTDCVDLQLCYSCVNDNVWEAAYISERERREALDSKDGNSGKSEQPSSTGSGNVRPKNEEVIDRLILLLRKKGVPDAEIRHAVLHGVGEEVESVQVNLKENRVMDNKLDAVKEESGTPSIEDSIESTSLLSPGFQDVASPITQDLAVQEENLLPVNQGSTVQEEEELPPVPQEIIQEESASIGSVSDVGDNDATLRPDESYPIDMENTELNHPEEEGIAESRESREDIDSDKEGEELLMRESLHPGSIDVVNLSEQTPTSNQDAWDI